MQQIQTILISITTLHITQQITQHHIIQIPIILDKLKYYDKFHLWNNTNSNTTYRIPQVILHIHTVIQLICPLMSLV